MVMVPHAGKMHFRHSDQQNSSGEDPDPRMGFATSVLAGSGSARHGLPPQAKNPSYAPDSATFDIIAWRCFATSMTSVRLSVRLSVTLVDCDYMVQRKVEIGTWQDALSSDEMRSIEIRSNEVRWGELYKRLLWTSPRFVK